VASLFFAENIASSILFCVVILLLLVISAKTGCFPLFPCELLLLLAGLLFAVELVAGVVPLAVDFLLLLLAILPILLIAGAGFLIVISLIF